MNEEKTFEAMLNESEVQPKEELINAPHPWTDWKVGGNVYKLKLTNGIIKMLERSFKKSLLLAVIDDGVPPVSVMVDVVQGAMQKYHHGMNSAKVEALFDAYIDEGHTVYDLLAEVIYPLLTDAGFFTKAMLEEMQTQLKASMTM